MMKKPIKGRKGDARSVNGWDLSIEMHDNKLSAIMDSNPDLLLKISKHVRSFVITFGLPIEGQVFMIDDARLVSVRVNSVYVWIDDEDKPEIAILFDA